MIRRQAHQGNYRAPGAGFVVWLVLGLIGCAPIEGGSNVQDRLPAQGQALTLADQWRSTAPGPGDKGCFARQTRPAVVETVTEQRLVTPEVRDPETGTVLRPATYETQTHHKIVEGREAMWFPAPCATAYSQEFVATLQRALQARNLYHGPISGQLSDATSRAIHRYQTARGLFSATLSVKAAQEMGLLAVTNAESVSNAAQP
ncbi:hypothetical protein BFP70_08250 [Thioclava sp. SK-1]|uniref:peptidoglycan-binding domain-containing protein n=1 Tax=Thioclava sp. SK-1 TaxID=1889770 RepID=UPI00082532CF|nr:peptidoglycan-binding domain-containing protein [Thioclava sp. SK-1]OCX66093.1 hypothetical protein BFP70_08250 [Thioclava sp. SK-1]